MEWKDAIDDTLRSTRATLQRLQERHASYEVAKRRAQDALHEPASSSALPSPTSPSSSPGLSPARRSKLRRSATLSHTQSSHYGRHTTFATPDGVLFPPPLPATTGHSRVHVGHYTASRDASVPAPPTVRYVDVTSASPREETLLRRPMAPGGAVQELASGMRLLRSQVKNLTTELELERTIRADGVREAKHYAGQHVDTVRLAIEQLRQENVQLRQGLRRVEAAVTPTPVPPAAPPSSSALTRPLFTATTATSSPSSTPQTEQSGAALDPAAMTSHDTAARSTFSLTQRVEQLEAELARQQRALQDRTQRTDGLLNDLVRAAVAREVERVRSVAREAAQDGVQAVVATVEASVQAELQRLRASIDDVKHTLCAAEQQRRAYELDGTAMASRLEAGYKYVQERLETNRIEAATQLAQGLESRCHPLRQDIDTLRRDLDELAQRGGAGGGATALDETAAELQAALRPQLQAELQTWLAARTETGIEGALDALRAEMTQRVAEMRGEYETGQAAVLQTCETRLAAQQDVAARHTETCIAAALADERSRYDKVRQDVDGLQKRLTECLQLVDDAQHSAGDLAQLVQRGTVVQQERQAKIESQLAALKQQQSALWQKADSARAAMGERVGELDGRLTETERVVAQVRNRVQTQQTAFETQISDLTHGLDERLTRLSRELVQSTTQGCEQRLHEVSEDVAQRVAMVGQQVTQLRAQFQREVAQGVSDGQQALQQVEHEVLRQAALLAQIQDELQRGRGEGPLATLAEVHRLVQESTSASDVRVTAVETKLLGVEQATRDAAVRLTTSLESLRTRLDEVDARATDRLEQLDRRTEQATGQLRSCQSSLQDLARRGDVLEMTQQRARQLCAEAEQRHDEYGAQLEARLQRMGATWSVNLAGLKSQCSVQGIVDAFTADPACCETLMQVLQAHAKPSRALLEAQTEHRRALAALREELQTLVQQETTRREEALASIESTLLRRAVEEARAAMQTCELRAAKEAGVPDATANLATVASLEERLVVVERVASALQGSLEAQRAVCDAREADMRRLIGVCEVHDGDDRRLVAVASDAQAGQVEPGEHDLAARVAAVEAAQSDDLAVTADALAALRDSLLQCVQRVNHALGPMRDEVAQGRPRLGSLEEVFVFLLHQVQALHLALESLQQNAVATLELVQQQEIDLVAVAPLQQCVLQLARQLSAVAAAVGMDLPSLEAHIESLLRHSETSRTQSCSTSEESEPSTHDITQLP